jgi:ATP-dependent RNA helicase RhlE
VTSSSFDGLGLAQPLQLALKAENYLKPTPIQAQAIPLLTQGRDLLGIAQTGTGKTAAFALPILHRLSLEQHTQRTPGGPRALILAPTRELARQIGERFAAYGRKLPLTSTVIFGGVNQHHQVKALKAGVDILIATPGRLLDLFNQRHVRLDKVSVLVLDEADRMLDMGFIHDVRKIVAACKSRRQTLLFSATMPPTIAKLADDILHNPERIDVSPKTVAVDRIARVRALEAFRSGKVRVLVATDIAARGIDVPNISHVINYELPNEPESYVHRIGRTARAGAEGAALSFCDQSERSYLRAIEKLMRRNVTVVEHHLAETAFQAGVEPPRRSRQCPAPAAKARRPGRTRSPRISEIPMLATPASQRYRTSYHSGEGHR